MSCSSCGTSSGYVDLVVGSTARLSVVVTLQDVNEDSSSVIVMVVDPNGTETAPSVVHDSVGSYHADVVVSTPGQWWYRWVSVLPISSVEGSFDVRASHVL